MCLGAPQKRRATEAVVATARAAKSLLLADAPVQDWAGIAEATALLRAAPVALAAAPVALAVALATVELAEPVALAMAAVAWLTRPLTEEARPLRREEALFIAE